MHRNRTAQSPLTSYTPKTPIAWHWPLCRHNGSVYNSSYLGFCGELNILDWTLTFFKSWRAVGLVYGLLQRIVTKVMKRTESKIRLVHDMRSFDYMSVTWGKNLWNKSTEWRMKNEVTVDSETGKWENDEPTCTKWGGSEEIWLTKLNKNLISACQRTVFFILIRKDNNGSRASAVTGLIRDQIMYTPISFIHRYDTVHVKLYLTTLTPNLDSEYWDIKVLYCGIVSVMFLSTSLDQILFRKIVVDLQHSVKISFTVILPH